VFTGDFNASLGVRDEDDHNGVLGPCGIRHVEDGEYTNQAEETEWRVVQGCS